jgi:hypothetical protein
MLFAWVQIVLRVQKLSSFCTRGGAGHGFADMYWQHLH